MLDRPGSRVGAPASWAVHMGQGEVRVGTGLLRGWAGLAFIVSSVWVLIPLRLGAGPEPRPRTPACSCSPFN